MVLSALRDENTRDKVQAVKIIHQPPEVLPEDVKTFTSQFAIEGKIKSGLTRQKLEIFVCQEALHGLV